MDLADEICATFIVSTTGDGENPDSMKVPPSKSKLIGKEFWKVLLNKNIPTDFLEDLSFAVFGLGDSKYDKYASMLSVIDIGSTFRRRNFNEGYCNSAHTKYYQK